MRTLTIGIALVCAVAGCVGDSSAVNDAGEDAGQDGTIVDGSKDVATDAPIGTCVFGSSHFGDGCKFGP